MPYSFSTFDEAIYQFISDYQPVSILDVGPGIGKIGSMASKSARNNKYSCKIDAYEIYKPYINQYELKWIYDKIYNENIMNIINKENILYDMIFFGDSLEHLKKENGIKLLSFLLPRCKFIIIKTPYNYPQGQVGDNIYEAHLSNWEPEDFENLFFHETQDHINKQNPDQIDTMNLFILKGEIE
jgi:2-polyprenyl-3-methyl-5-hydroxy-6-metoxy-1,4-benzoquinol methylase